jgi:hypothetical protein
MTDILAQIDEYVENAIKGFNPSQIATLKALLFVGYRGERDYILLELLKGSGEEEIAHSDLTESYTYTSENATTNYARIKPEFFRSVRKHIFKK